MQVLKINQENIEHKICIYVISLKKAHERRKSVENQLSKFNFQWKFIDAIDANSEEVANAPKHDPSTRWHKSLVEGEIACYMSHMKAWNAMKDDKVKYGLILEDDFFLRKDLNEIIGCLYQINSEYDIIKLYGIPKIARQISKYSSGSLSIRLVRAFSVTGITVALWIDAKALPLLLEKGKNMSRPVDMDLKHYWEYPLKIFHAKPSLFSEISDQLGGTSIKHRKNITSLKSRFFRLFWKLRYYMCCLFFYLKS